MPVSKVQTALSAASGPLAITNELRCLPGREAIERHLVDRTINMALVGVGMFGGDVHLRAYADLQRVGISGQLARVGLDDWSRDLAPVRFNLVAVATRTRQSARRARRRFKDWTGHAPAVFAGERPWLPLLEAHPGLDVVAVATPDHLHTEVILAALAANAHVITEKPMCLELQEADRIIAAARRKERIVGVDMHKRYDPDHLRVRHEIRQRIGEPLYGQAYLEEPLALSTRTFKWVEQSDPFSYVGPHWVDLVYYYYQSKPVSLTAIGQKKRLARDGIDAFDAVQVRVDFENGMSFHFHNNWITPADFEGPVNQGHEIVGTEGKVESDQQYRGLRWWHAGGGSRTANTHFTRDVARVDGSQAYVGYGVDSLVASLAAISRVKFFGARCASLAACYPTAAEARITVAILQAARIVRDLNCMYLRQGKGAPVTARFGSDGLTIIDPNQPTRQAMFKRIYRLAI
jgi:predicted dehydrogenase